MIETDCNNAVLLGIVAGVYIAGAYITAFLMGLFFYDDGLDDDDYFVIMVWPFSLLCMLLALSSTGAMKAWDAVAGATRRISLVGRFSRWVAIPLRPYALGRMAAKACSRIASKFAAKGAAGGAKGRR